jgi:formylglycine-generating enzyme required for sulfatase activity
LIEDRIMNPAIKAIVVVGAISCLAPLAEGVTIPTVPVNDAGNPGEAQPQGTFGAVANGYRIATHEVTNGQYAAFLNAKAASDPLALYSTSMGSNARGGITRSGFDGAYTYAPKANMGDKPVNFVSWYDAIRFANWLHNGAGSGDTETGAYTLVGGTPVPSNANTIARDGGALWFLTSEHEWYKAAYYDPTLGGGAGDYWDYPTHSDSPPAIATADSNGNIANPGANVANYALGADWNSLDGHLTTVGSAGLLSASYYGTSDQGGNIFEWNETLSGGSLRGFRGGAWNIGASPQLASERGSATPTIESDSLGFRVATIPEPGSAALALLAAGLSWWWRKRIG